MAKKTSKEFLSDGFVNLAARMGVGAQNVLSQGTYELDLLTRNRVKLESMYRGSWIVGAAVDSIAEDMTRAGITIKGDGNPEDTQKIQSSLVRLGVWSKLTESIKWGRLYGGAAAYVDIEGQDPSEPLRLKTIKKGQFVGLRVFDRWQLGPSLTEFVDSGPDFGLPASYQVYATTAGVGESVMVVHHSRMIRQIGIHLPSWQAAQEQYWGESVIERPNDRIISFDTVTSGIANLVQKAHLRTVQIEGLREILAAGGKAEENLLKMFAHMRYLQTSEGLTLLDSKDVFAAHNYTFSGITDVVLQFGQQISGAFGIPLVRLFGQSPAGLNSTGESDLRMYYDSVSAQQESRLREGLSRILAVLYRSTLGVDVPEDLDFDFVPLWQTSQTEKAAISKTVTESVALAFSNGVIDETTALKELKQSSECTGIFSNITEAQIEATIEEEPPDASISVGAEGIQQATMNGAQVASMVDIVMQAAAGAIPRASAVQMLLTAFPVTESQANDILGDVGKGFEPSAQPEKKQSSFDRVMDWVKRG